MCVYFIRIYVWLCVCVCGKRVIVESQLEHIYGPSNVEGRTVDSNKPDTNSTQIIHSFSARTENYSEKLFKYIYIENLYTREERKKEERYDRKPYCHPIYTIDGLAHPSTRPRAYIWVLYGQKSLIYWGEMNNAMNAPLSEFFKVHVRHFNNKIVGVRLVIAACVRVCLRICSRACACVGVFVVIFRWFERT